MEGENFERFWLVKFFGWPGEHNSLCFFFPRCLHNAFQGVHGISMGTPGADHPSSHEKSERKRPAEGKRGEGEKEQASRGCQPSRFIIQHSISSLSQSIAGLANMFEEKRTEQISESLHETAVIPWIRVTLLRDVIPFFRSSMLRNNALDR